MEDVFERGKIGWEGNFSFENFKKGCNDIFLLLELLPNMPDMQSLKVLLLFAATTRLSILCHHPFSNTSFDQKSLGHPKVGVSRSHRHTNTNTVAQTNMAML